MLLLFSAIHGHVCAGLLEDGTPKPPQAAKMWPGCDTRAAGPVQSASFSFLFQTGAACERLPSFNLHFVVHPTWCCMRARCQPGALGVLVVLL
jgi:hypothetical protein